MLWTKNDKTWAWQFFVTFLGWLSDPFQWLNDLQIGDEKVTLNHLGESIEAFNNFQVQPSQCCIQNDVCWSSHQKSFPCFLWVQSCQSMRRKEDDGDRKRREEQVHGPGLMVHITPHYTTLDKKYMKVLQKTWNFPVSATHGVCPTLSHGCGQWAFENWVSFPRAKNIPTSTSSQKARKTKTPPPKGN